MELGNRYMAADNDEIMRAIGRLEGQMEAVQNDVGDIKGTLQTLSDRLTEYRLRKPNYFWGLTGGGTIVGVSYLIKVINSLF